jgi:hypothetical protein
MGHRSRLLGQHNGNTLRRLHGQSDFPDELLPHLNRRVRKRYLPLGGRHFWSRRAYELAYAPLARQAALL